MKELAYVARVSRATVDRVLNNRGRVNQETADRIRKLAESMGYQPNIAAKSLAVRHKNLKIGFIINRTGNIFFEDVIKGAKKAAAEESTFGISVSIKYASQGFGVQEQISLIDEFVDKGYGALAITPINDQLIGHKLNDIIQNGIPVIAVTADITNVDYLAYIGCNHEKSGRIAANMVSLIMQGSAHIAIVIGSRKMLGHSQRLHGFEEAIRQQFPDLRLVSIVENNDDDITSYNRVTELIKQHPEIDMLYFATAGVEGGIRAIIDQEKVGAIKIISFDLTECTRRYLKKGIVSAVLCQDPFAQGYKAIKLLSEKLLSNIDPESTRLYTETSIYIKESL